MRVGDTCVGVVSVQSTQTEGIYGADDERLLSTIAANVGVALQNARLFNETTEALSHQTATADILRVISSSPTDVQPVFDAIARNSVTLCGALFANVFRFDGDLIHWVSSDRYASNAVEMLRSTYPSRPSLAQVSGRVILTNAVVRMEDALADPDYDRRFADIGGWRRMLGVPMLREGSPIGVIVVGWAETGPIPKAQEELLKTFADQAVIAIENVRLFTETKEALERQTATAEILKVIAGSPTEVQPVFDVIVESAVRLCGARFGRVYRYDGSVIQMVAGHGLSTSGLAQVQRVFPRTATDDTIVGRVILTRRPFYVRDIEREGTVPALSRQMIEALGTRSQVTIPMLRAGEPIGAITMGWDEPEAFDDQQVALLQTFADQAVIAIENVRLFNETKEALERQTATSQILRAISGSLTDIAPVFDTILENAIGLCGGDVAVLWQYDGHALRFAAGKNASQEGEAYSREHPLELGTYNPTPRAGLERRTMHVLDVFAEPGYRPLVPPGIAPYRLKAPTVLAVPLLRENDLLGVITIWRFEKRLFTEKQVEMVNTFAAQAVIAIENVRLFNETKEALEQQTASAEILKVISGSPTDVQPVFEAIVQSGVRLFDGAAVAVVRPEGGEVRLMAIAEADRERAAKWASRFPNPLNRDYMHGAAILDCAMVDVPDVLQAQDRFVEGRRNFTLTGYRAITVAPMVRDNVAIGAISVVRIAPGPLSEKQKALLLTFADQAVIAIENVRLFKELQARTEALTRSVGQLTALGEVGQAISSTLDLETVLKTIVSRAVQLTGLDGGSIYEYDERAEEFRLQAAENMPQDVTEDIRKAPTRKGEGALGRTAITLEPTQVPDTLDDSYQSARKELLIRAGYRALLAVPLLREDRLLGGLLVNRKTAGSFAPEIVELLKTFATQSALAIQNARLFREIAEKGGQLEAAQVGFPRQHEPRAADAVERNPWF